MKDISVSYRCGTFVYLVHISPNVDLDAFCSALSRTIYSQITSHQQQVPLLDLDLKLDIAFLFAPLNNALNKYSKNEFQNKSFFLLSK